jgi:hypothetical protein
LRLCGVAVLQCCGQRVTRLSLRNGMLPISLERTLFSAAVLQSGKGERGLRQRGEWRIKN